MKKYVSKTFKKEILQELCWNEDLEADGDTYKVISDEIYDTSRWSIHYTMIFECNGLTYQTTYSRGATESQDESPYEYDVDNVMCYQVEPYDKTITDYRLIEEK